MEQFMTLVIIAVVVEGIVTWTKSIVVDKKLQWQVIVALIIGELFAFNYGADILAQFGLVGYSQVLGIVATGIFLSRGAGYINDIISKILSYKVTS